MLKLPATAATCVCLAAVVLAGCGGGSGTSSSSTTKAATTPARTASDVSNDSAQPSTVVARIGPYTVTKAVLSQWMTETLGADYYEVATHQVHSGLVSEPANYAACVAGLKTLTPIPGKGKPQPQPTEAQLMKKYEQLYETIKLQALGYLVSTYWSQYFDAKHGLQVSAAEVRRGLKQMMAEYPKPGQFTRLLAQYRRTLSQQTFIIRASLLQRKLLNETHQPGGLATVAALAKEAESPAYLAVCTKGYVVEHCQGFKAPPRFSNTNNGAPDLLLTEIARWRPETSHGFTGEPLKF